MSSTFTHTTISRGISSLQASLKPSASGLCCGVSAQSIRVLLAGLDGAGSPAKKLRLPLSAWQRLSARQHQNPAPGPTSRPETRASAIPKPGNAGTAKRGQQLPAQLVQGADSVGEAGRDGIDEATVPHPPAQGAEEFAKKQVHLQSIVTAGTDGSVPVETAAGGDAKGPRRGSTCPREKSSGRSARHVSRDDEGPCQLAGQDSCDPFISGHRIARSPPAAVRTPAGHGMLATSRDAELPGIDLGTEGPAAMSPQEHVSPGPDIGVLESEGALRQAPQEASVRAVPTVAQNADGVDTPMGGIRGPAVASSSTPWPLISPWRAPWLLGSPLPHGVPSIAIPLDGRAWILSATYLLVYCRCMFVINHVLMRILLTLSWRLARPCWFQSAAQDDLYLVTTVHQVDLCRTLCRRKMRKGMHHVPPLPLHLHLLCVFSRKGSDLQDGNAFCHARVQVFCRGQRGARASAATLWTSRRTQSRSPPTPFPHNPVVPVALPSHRGPSPGRICLRPRRMTHHKTVHF